MKPRYTGLMVIVQKTIRTSYIIAELDGAKSEFQVAGFCLIPYFPRMATAMPIVLSAPIVLILSMPSPVLLPYYIHLVQQTDLFNLFPLH